MVTSLLSAIVISEVFIGSEKIHKGERSTLQSMRARSVGYSACLKIVLKIIIKNHKKEDYSILIVLNNYFSWINFKLLLL